MENLFHFELISPEARLVSEDVHMVTIPGEDGEMGVLAGHAPVLTSLRSGVVSVVSQKGEMARRFFVEGGFVDVDNARCTILAQGGVDADSLDASVLDAEIAALVAEIEELDGPEKLAQENRLATLHARRSII